MEATNNGATAKAPHCSVSLTYAHDAHHRAAGIQQLARKTVRARVSTIVVRDGADLLPAPSACRYSEEIVSLNPLGSVTSNALLPHGVS